MNYSFIEEENDKILNYETVDDCDNNDNSIQHMNDKKKFIEEGIESFTPGQNNPSNMNNPGVNMQHPHRPPMRQQQLKPPRNQPPQFRPQQPKFRPQHKPHYQKPRHHHRPHPPQQNNTYVYDTVVYDRNPDYPYYNPYYDQYVNPFYNPYFNQPPVEVIEVEKNNDDKKDNNKKDDINVTNFLLFLIIIIGLFFLMKKN